MGRTPPVKTGPPAPTRTTIHGPPPPTIHPESQPYVPSPPVSPRAPLLPDEDKIVARAQKGDRRAFAQIYRAYARTLYGYVLVPMLGDGDDADGGRGGAAQLSAGLWSLVRSFWRDAAPL